MPTQSGSIDLNSYKMVNDNASKTATNYIQADSTGIKIANADPATATTYQHQTATKTEFVVNNLVQAEIGADGATFGNSNSTRMVLDNHSMILKDKNNNIYSRIEDNRNPNSNTYSYTCATWISSNDDKYITMPDKIAEINNIRSDKYNDSIDDYDYEINSNQTAVTIYNPYNVGINVTVACTLLYSNDSSYSAITFGSRRNITNLGKNTLSLGERNYVYGVNSAAIGTYLTVSGTNQLVCGRNNIDEPDKLFIVGNGTAGNAFTVDTTNNARVLGTLYLGNEDDQTYIDHENALISNDLHVGGNLTVDGNIINGITSVNRPIYSGGSRYTITSSTIKYTGHIAQLYLECNRNNNLAIPTNGAINEKIGYINTNVLKPITEIETVSNGDLPLFITIKTNGDIMITSAMVSVDRTNDNYTTLKSTRVIKIGVMYMKE